MFKHICIINYILKNISAIANYLMTGKHNLHSNDDIYHLYMRYLTGIKTVIRYDFQDFAVKISPGYLS